MQKKNKKIFVTGHNGLVGSAVIRRLKQKGYSNILTINKKKLDLRDQKKVFKFFEDQNIDSVINAAGKVGGIYANNKYKAEFNYYPILNSPYIQSSPWQDQSTNPNAGIVLDTETFNGILPEPEVRDGKYIRWTGKQIYSIISSISHFFFVLGSIQI